MKFANQLSLFLLAMMTMMMVACNKEKPYGIAEAPPYAHFTGDVFRTINLTDSTPPIVIGVGTTDVANADRIVSFAVTSPSGAALGTQYQLNATSSVTIPANGAVADLILTPNFAEYASGRRDTIYLAIKEPSLKSTSFQDTVRLIIIGPTPTTCTEDNVDLVQLLGGYANTIETLATNPPYGPYLTTISSATPTSPTTALIVVENIWDNGWGPIEFNLDWTDPINRTAIVVDQAAIPGSDAGDLNPTYAGQTVAVRAPSAALSPTPGTYSYCSQTFTLKMQLGVTGLGFFNALYTVNMAR